MISELSRVTLSFKSPEQSDDLLTVENRDPQPESRSVAAIGWSEEQRGMIVGLHLKTAQSHFICKVSQLDAVVSGWLPQLTAC